MTKGRKAHVLFHNNCVDGFTAFHAAHCHLDMDVVMAWPVSYGEEFPMCSSSYEGDDVYILDFSYPRGVLELVAEKANSVVVLDHHLSAQKDLEGMPGLDDPGNLHVKFDMNKSGAVLAWEYFTKSSGKAPLLYQYVQDRDLWKFALPKSKEISAAISNTPHDLAEWEELDIKLSGDNESVIQVGTQILRYQDSVIGNNIDRANQNTHITGFTKGKAVSINFGPTLSSEMGNTLLRRYPDAQYAVCYWRDDARDVYQYSLRSMDSRADVSVICKSLGGGGHRNAAGFADKRNLIGNY